YYRHSNYPGGLKERTANEMRTKYPEKMLETAVRGMLPKGPLGRKMSKKLYVYRGPEHKHHAQQPQTYELRGYLKGGKTIGSSTIIRYRTPQTLDGTCTPGSRKWAVRCQWTRCKRLFSI